LFSAKVSIAVITPSYEDGSVINRVEIVDHKDDIQDVNKTMKLIVGLLLVIVLLKVVKIYKRSVQRRRDQHHALEKVVTHIGA